MPTVYGLHEIELQPGWSPTVRAVLRRRGRTDGRARLENPSSKGDRGERAGKYLVLLEIESLEARDRYFPSPGEGVGGVHSVLRTAPRRRPRHSKMAEDGPIRIEDRHFHRLHRRRRVAGAVAPTTSDLPDRLICSHGLWECVSYATRRSAQIIVHDWSATYSSGWRKCLTCQGETGLAGVRFA